MSKKNILTTTKTIQNKQTIVAMVLVIASLIMFSASLFVLRASKPTVYEYGVYKPGTSIKAGSAIVTINSITYNQGQNSFVAPKGKQYIVLNTTFQNQTTKPIFLSPSTETYIKDQDANLYYMTRSGLENPLRAGDLIAGDKITGELSYLVPTGKTYTMYIDAIWSGGVVSVRLN